MPSPRSRTLKAGSTPRARSPSSWSAEGPAMTTPSSRPQMGTEESRRAGSRSPGNSAIHRSGSMSGPADPAAGSAAQNPARPISAKTPTTTVRVNGLIGASLKRSGLILLPWRRSAPASGRRKVPSCGGRLWLSRPQVHAHRPSCLALPDVTGQAGEVRRFRSRRRCTGASSDRRVVLRRGRFRACRRSCSRGSPALRRRSRCSCMPRTPVRPRRRRPEPRPYRP